MVAVTGVKEDVKVNTVVDIVPIVEVEAIGEIEADIKVVTVVEVVALV